MFHSSFNIIYCIFILVFFKCDLCFGDFDLESDDSDVSLSPGESVVKYLFYNRHRINDPDIVLLTSMNTSFPHFDNDLPTKIIIHGFNSACDERFAVTNKDAALKYADVNVICVEWASMSNAGILNAIQGIQTTKDAICDLIESLNVSMKKIHLIGHSFGAHIAGLASRKLQQNGFERIGHITGLDPAAIFMNYENFLRLSKESADLVEVLHTSPIGAQYPIGHFDFFPNGGILQPGCVEDQLVCSHSRAHQLYAECLANPFAFPALYCDSVEKLTNRSCTNYNEIYMGNVESYNQDRPRKEGIYYLQTLGDPPFSPLKIIDNDTDLLQHPTSGEFGDFIRLHIFGLHLWLQKIFAVFNE